MTVNGICGSLKKHFRIQQKHHSNYVFEIIVAQGQFSSSSVSGKNTVNASIF